MAMEQFKKWSKLSWSNSLGERVAEENAWKAALEWALTTQGRFDWRFCSMISPSIIEKELNGKKRSNHELQNR